MCMILGSTESTTTNVSGERETRSLVRYSALIPSDVKRGEKGEGEGRGRKGRGKGEKGRMGEKGKGEGRNGK